MPIQEVRLASCHKEDCIYYQEMSIKVGDEFATGIICHRQCMVCMHLTKADLYTRLKVGE